MKALDILNTAGLHTGPETMQVAKIHTDLAYRLECIGGDHTVALVHTDGTVSVTFFQGPDTLRRARTHIARLKRDTHDLRGDQ